jgi:hypothetical protein
VWSIFIGYVFVTGLHYLFMIRNPFFSQLQSAEGEYDVYLA